MSFVKKASHADTGKAAALLEAIRSENPKHWPYGLHVGMFDPGDLYLIQKSASEDPVGFVGWQERNVGDQRVGLYSIGVLPAFRHQGIAKEAVAQLLLQKSAGVDRVAAIVMEDNLPSKNLAGSLGVPILAKKAGWKDHALKTIYGLGMASLIDASFNKNKGALGYFSGVHDDPWTAADFAKNLISNTAAAYAPKSWGLAGKVGPALVTAATTAMGPALREFQRSNDIAQKNLDLEIQNRPTTVKSDSLPWLLGAGGIAAALGLGAYGINRGLHGSSDRGKMRVTLPTKNPGDVETVLELPYDQESSLTPALRARIDLDTKRRLYAETKERIRHRRALLETREANPVMDDDFTETVPEHP